MGEGHGRRLRCGFTTGTAAAAAGAAALSFILSGRPPASVQVELLTADIMEIAVHSCRKTGSAEAVCSVIKDAGDDPDVTNGAEICARVGWRAGHGEPDIVVKGGAGVGVATKPGLEIGVGKPAINPGPMAMIRRSVLKVMADNGVSGHAEVEIFVPEGEILAKKTLNFRLGIMGGISILGTTGIVRPLSHEAYTATIRAALSVARAAGLTEAVLTTGRRSERLAMEHLPLLPEEAFIQIGDYFSFAMETAASLKFERAVLAVFFGKAVKMAQKIPHTHARSAELGMDQLARWALESGGGEALAEKVAGANTAREVFELAKTACPALIEKVGREAVRAAKAFGGGCIDAAAVIFDFDGSLWFDSGALSKTCDDRP